MTKRKFSIVIPSYNQGHFIEATLLSILNQDYANYEIIVLDGGSTDDTVSILRKYENRIAHWRSEKDKGQSDAIVKGFDVATGDVLSWLNSDDVYLPGTLSAVNAAFERTGAEVVYGNMRLIDHAGKIIGERHLTDFLPDSIRDAYLCGGFGIYQPASFWTRDLYRRSGGVDAGIRFCMDNDLFNKFVIAGGKFSFVDKMLAGFRVHGDSKTSTLQTVADAERAMLYQKYVVERGVANPAGKRFLARAFRTFKLLRNGKIARVIYSRFFDRQFKWVP